MPLISGTIGAGLQYAATQDTNKTNLQIAQETNELNAQLTREINAANIQMNKENNLLQMELAQKSHEWSTAANQLQELMAAGLTEQQARQVIAGNGVGSSSFPVATTQPGVAQAPHYETPQMVAPDLSALAGAGSEIEGSIFGALGQSLTAADGGALGWSVAQDYISGLMKFAEDGKIDFDNLGSPADLMKYATGLPDGDLKNEVMDFIHGDAANKVRGFVPAQRALYNFMQSNMGFKTQAQQINESMSRTLDNQAAVELKNAQISAIDIQNNLNQLNITWQDYQNQIADLCVEFQRKSNQKLGIEIDEEKIRKEILEQTSQANIDATLAEAASIQEVACANAKFYRDNAGDLQAMMTQNLSLQIEQASAAILYYRNEQQVEKDDATIMKTMSWSKKARHAFSRYSYNPFAEFNQFATGVGAMNPIHGNFSVNKNWGESVIRSTSNNTSQIVSSNINSSTITHVPYKK